jgi:hypothetical protein
MADKIKDITIKRITELIGDGGKCIDPFTAIVTQEALAYCLEQANRKLESISRIFPGANMDTSKTLATIETISNTILTWPRCKPDVLAPLVPGWKPSTPKKPEAPKPAMTPKGITIEKAEQTETKKSSKVEELQDATPPPPDWMPKGKFYLEKDTDGNVVGTLDNKGAFYPPDLRPETLTKIWEKLQGVSVKDKIAVQDAWVKHYITQNQEGRTETSPVVAVPPAAVILAKTIPVPGRQDLGAKPAAVGVESSDLETILDRLQSTLDEGDKSGSLKRFKKVLEKIDPDQIEGIEDIDSLIEDYEGITKAGMTPEEYAEARADAFTDIANAAEELTLAKAEEEESKEEAPVAAQVPAVTTVTPAPVKAKTPVVKVVKPAPVVAPITPVSPIAPPVAIPVVSPVAPEGRKVEPALGTATETLAKEVPISGEYEVALLLPGDTIPTKILFTNDKEKIKEAKAKGAKGAFVWPLNATGMKIVGLKKGDTFTMNKGGGITLGRGENATLIREIKKL